MRRAALVLSVVSVLSVVVVLAGCGRKATEADCAAIVDRNVEVQMKKMNINDPATITKKQEEIRGQFSESLKGCVGRRITDNMMQCVKTADSVDGIDQCMR
jgi:predicted small lipoprotein YifL